MLVGSGTAGAIYAGLNHTVKSDIWGGVGVACMDWSIPSPNLLAAVTFKTKALEVWDTDTSTFIRRIMF